MTFGPGHAPIMRKTTMALCLICRFLRTDCGLTGLKKFFMFKGVQELPT